MRPGTKRRTRESSLRCGRLASLTRVLRQRYLPTNGCHAGSAPHQGVIRVYQNDQSSKSPALSVASVSWKHQKPQEQPRGHP